MGCGSIFQIGALKKKTVVYPACCKGLGKAVRENGNTTVVGEIQRKGFINKGKRHGNTPVGTIDFRGQYPGFAIDDGLLRSRLDFKGQVF